MKRMNKIDILVRNKILQYSELFRNRFDVFAEMMTNSCYCWTGQGELNYFREEEEVSPEQVLSKYRENLEKCCEKYPLQNVHESLANLHNSFIVEEKQKLHAIKFLIENIDIYASTWCGVDHRQKWYLLWYIHRYGVDKYCPINNKPNNIDEEWRLAIKDWLYQLVLSANSAMGFFKYIDDDDLAGNWEALPKYATTYNWIKDIYKEYTTDADRLIERQRATIIKEALSGHKDDPGPPGEQGPPGIDFIGET